MNICPLLKTAANILKINTDFVFGLIAILSKKLKYRDDIIITRGNVWGIRKTISVPAIKEKRTTLSGDVANFAKVFRASRSARPDLIIASQIKKEEAIKIKLSERKIISREKKTVGETRKFKT